MQEIDCDPKQLPGHKGYDSEAVRPDIEQFGGEGAISSTATRKIQQAVDKTLYALHNPLALLQWCPAARYDKLIVSFAAVVVLLARIRIWAKFAHTA
jgi:hypothetical protein